MCEHPPLQQLFPFFMLRAASGRFYFALTHSVWTGRKTPGSHISHRSCLTPRKFSSELFRLHVLSEREFAQNNTLYIYCSFLSHFLFSENCVANSPEFVPVNSSAILSAVNIAPVAEIRVHVIMSHCGAWVQFRRDSNLGRSKLKFFLASRFCKQDRHHSSSGPEPPLPLRFLQNHAVFRQF